MGFVKQTQGAALQRHQPIPHPFVVKKVGLSRLCFVITMADAQWQTGPKELDPAALGLAIRERHRAAKMTQEMTASLGGIAKKSLFKMEGREYLPLVYWVVGTAVAIV